MTIFTIVVLLSLYVRYVPDNNVIVNKQVDINAMTDFYDIDGDGIVDRFMDADGKLYNTQGVRIYDNDFIDGIDQ